MILLRAKTVIEMAAGWRKVIQACGGTVPSDNQLLCRIRNQYMLAQWQKQKKIKCNADLSRYRSFSKTEHITVGSVFSDITFTETADVFPTDALVATISLSVEVCHVEHISQNRDEDIPLRRFNSSGYGRLK